MTFAELGASTADLARMARLREEGRASAIRLPWDLIEPLLEEDPKTFVITHSRAKPSYEEPLVLVSKWRRIAQ